jgi:integrase
MSTTQSSRYQQGTVERTPRAKGPDVWVFRWRELDADDRRVQRKKIIGTVEQYKSKSAAQKAVENFRAEVNADLSRAGGMTVAQAWGHFQEHELRDPEMARSESTVENYLTLFKAHIIPKWGSTPLDGVEAVKVEAWLRALKSVPKPHEVAFSEPPESRPLAPASKAKIKSRMYSLFAHARRHKLCDVNPMETVRQGSKRLKKPDVLTLDEIRALMVEVPNPAIRLAVLIAGATGLRRSEIRGLKWHDVDTDDHWLTPTQGSVRKHITTLKTRASGETIPIPEALSEAFLEWREQTPYRADDDWVFGSPSTAGKSPYWFDSALYRQLRPAAKRANITKRIGWHTFRRSLATVLTSKKEAVKVVQELMRHADPRITLALYAQGEEGAKRAAQEHVSGLFVVQKKAS